MRDPILITGCARSGTSMTAGIVQRCGAWGGLTYGPNEWNKSGMYENKEIREHILKPYLFICSADPLGQDPLPDIDRLIPLANLREKIETVIKFQGYKRGPWYYKGAKMCLVWPTFHEAFPTARWIIIRRRDEDIVNSCLRTPFMRAHSTEAGWQAWIDVHKKRFEEMIENPDMDTVEVWPEKFVLGDFDEIRAAMEHVGLHWNEKAAAQFVNPKLWRPKDGARKCG